MCSPETEKSALPTNVNKNVTLVLRIQIKLTVKKLRTDYDDE